VAYLVCRTLCRAGGNDLHYRNLAHRVNWFMPT
jgi:hypothetical protein